MAGPKTLQITTTARCITTEEWTYQVPADFELAADDVLTFLSSEAPEGVSFVGVTDEVSNEEDREYVDHHFEES